MSQTRRLAAILAADVAGYWRLIGSQEITVAALLQQLDQRHCQSAMRGPFTPPSRPSLSSRL
jgi:hypothetical protein